MEHLFAHASQTALIPGDYRDHLQLLYLEVNEQDAEII